jgi:hypothetical protein
MMVSSRKRRAAQVILGLTMITAAACAADRNDAPTLARVHVTSNGVIHGDVLPVRYQPFDAPELEHLADREQLRALVAGTPRQFDQIVRVQDWVNAQWADGTPNPYPPWNAVTILDWIRTGKTGGFCAQYAQVFLQSLAALGFTARYIEIGSRENPYAHYLTEVWSNDFDKWMVMDADFNVHFERNGVPLSAVEIHDALVSSTLADVVPVFHSRSGHATPSSWPLHTAELYYYLRYHLNANHLSRPGDPPFERFSDMIELDDARVPAWEVSPVASAYPKERLTRQRTSDRHVVSGKLNQVQLDIRSAVPGSVTLELRDNIMQRAAYEYRLMTTGAQPEAWQSTSASTITVRLPDAGGRLDVRGVNIRGVTGPSATLAIDPAEAARRAESQP